MSLTRTVKEACPASERIFWLQLSGLQFRLSLYISPKIGPKEWVQDKASSLRRKYLRHIDPELHFCRL
ncbi:unnamed protein product [Dracunculus medinensis]|uniref:Uncharacterized protein n=1 Tax=Dracunculus medinensis TaxID=318479 RepID=A0A0N4U8W1_DRAME|nr:unnamed protein product [Dracunculus medinensis]